jgi:hypothetical protein
MVLLRIFLIALAAGQTGYCANLGFLEKHQAKDKIVQEPEDMDDLVELDADAAVFGEISDTDDSETPDADSTAIEPGSDNVLYEKLRETPADGSGDAQNIDSAGQDPGSDAALYNKPEQSPVDEEGQNSDSAGHNLGSDAALYNKPKQPHVTEEAQNSDSADQNPSVDVALYNKAEQPQVVEESQNADSIVQDLASSAALQYKPEQPHVPEEANTGSQSDVDAQRVDDLRPEPDSNVALSEKEEDDQKGQDKGEDALTPEHHREVELAAVDPDSDSV